MASYQKDLVSVIIPTYNRAETIAKAVSSVLNQTLRDLEVIIVDDCSSDHTAEVVEKIQDNRVRYLPLDSNHGAAYARNWGCAHALGEYIAFQDSADEWLPEKLEKQLAFLKQTGSDFVFCRVECYDLGQTKPRYYPDWDIPQDRILEEILLRSGVDTPTIFMRHAVFDSLTFNVSLRRMQDWDYAIRVAQQFRIAYQPEVFSRSRQQKNSLTASYSNFGAFRDLYQLHAATFQQYPKIDAIMLYTIGSARMQDDLREALDYFQRSLRVRPRIKTIIKYCYCRLKRIVT